MSDNKNSKENDGLQSLFDMNPEDIFNTDLLDLTSDFKPNIGSLFGKESIFAKSDAKLLSTKVERFALIPSSIEQFGDTYTFRVELDITKPKDKAYFVDVIDLFGKKYSLSPIENALGKYEQT